MKKYLTTSEKAVILEKSTEPPFSGVFTSFNEPGTYLCKQCHAPLFVSESKFDAGCGWPSFDEALPDAVKRQPDADGRRTEILCATCDGHLGHVFEGEGFTPKDTRYCVNSISMDFTTLKPEALRRLETAIFAGGCFWGVEHLMQQAPGVLSVTSGYIGGHTQYPTYKAVKAHLTGHAEAVSVLFDPEQTTYETLCKLFFEIHDPEQADGQGPDIGPQYRSEIFYSTPAQRAVAERLIGVLKEKGYRVVTKVTPATTFWAAEDYHQDYYERKGTEPYCHFRAHRFE